ncbi:MAG: DUF1579 family protein [Acidobacteriota bacterium]
MAKAETKKETTHMREPALERLNVFAGKWKMQGDQYTTDFGPAAKVIGTEEFEWLHGEKFLIHRLEGKLGENDMTCIEIIGHDAAEERFSMDTFYNNGMKQKWELHEQHPGKWMISGDWPHEDKTVKVRCMITFAHDGNTNIAKWESQKDDSSWETFWDLKAVRAN